MPGLGTAGSGDVLAGKPADRRRGADGMIAPDAADRLPEALPSP